MANDFFKYLSLYGLKDTWEAVIYNNSLNKDFKRNENIKEDFLKNLSYYEISDLYEESLAYVNKLNKKEQGQYYTPKDVCEVLAKKALEFKEGVWCDPCCGIGNISYEFLRRKPEMISSMIFCDLDSLALKICKFLFSKFFGVDYFSLNNFYNCNFLTSDLKYDYVIMNPPYGKFNDAKEDLYISFMKKACMANGFISLTPCSFTNSRESDLRKQILSFKNVVIYNFDNIPDCIFNGKKKGVFNTNTSNSVRAAITVCNNEKNNKQITPLLRWKSEHREKLLNGIDDYLCFANLEEKRFLKLYPKTESFLNFGDVKIKDLISSTPTEFKLTIPSTPRYYISASIRDLNRTSKHILYFKNKEAFESAYLFLNSSYSYWWWRINEGGITLSKNNLLEMKIKMVKNEELFEELKEEENTNMVIKMNAGKPNENIKHTAKVVEKLNSYLKVFDLFIAHSNDITEIEIN